MSNYIELGGESYSKAWFKSVSEDYALAVLGPSHGRDRIINVWKQANGKSKPNYATKDKKANDKKKK